MIKILLQKLWVLSVCFFAVIIFTDIANACSCSNPLLKTAIEKSPNIVLLKLQAVEKYQNGESRNGEIKQSKLTVEKVFKGKLKVGDTLIFGQGSGTDCIWTFEVYI